jgi:hypothetical protein
MSTPIRFSRVPAMIGRPTWSQGSEPGSLTGTVRLIEGKGHAYRNCLTGQAGGDAG